MQQPSSLDLIRLPKKHHDSLRAWDTADQFLVNRAFEIAPNASWLILNDAFGALSCFSGNHPHICSGDSYTAFESTKLNRSKNGLDETRLLSTDELIDVIDSLDVGLVILRLPKTYQFLEQQLEILNRSLANKTPVLMGAMQKHIDRSVFERVDATMDEMQAYRAEKKAKCLLAYTRKPDGQFDASNYGFFCDAIHQNLIANANVYSASKLDNGARLMMTALEQAPRVDTVLDLACGNGVLGIRYYDLHKPEQTLFIDESFQAVAAAEHNWNVKERVKAQFICSNGIPEDMQGVDLVLLNPPFHQGHVVTDHIALHLFKQTSQCLAESGELWVVGNRHLGYHQSLKQFFKKVDCVVSNAKFSVLRCLNVKAL